MPAAKIVPQSAFDARKEIGTVMVSELVEKYMVALVFATRYPDRYGTALAKLLRGPGLPMIDIVREGETAGHLNHSHETPT